MSFIENIKERARKKIKKIVLPEATDIRVLKAVEIIQKEGYAKPILIGNQEEILDLVELYDIEIGKTKIIDPTKSDKTEKYAEMLYELRKNKGMKKEEAKEIIKDQVYYATMMLKNGDADGLVSGAVHSSSDTLRPALQILKTAPDTKIVSAFFVIIVPDCKYGENGIFIFSDCGLVENPNSQELAEIAISSAKSFEQLVEKPAKIGMLSYSTYGSAKSETTKKVIDATVLAKLNSPNLKIDGELQLDAAIIPEIAEIKAKGSNIAGQCNTLIFPDLNSGNIGYKLVQRLAHAEAYGPLCQGIAKPVNDLSRGCSAEDIAGVVAITAVQANNK